MEKLATEVASLAKETKTEAIRRALIERKARLRLHAQTKRARLERFLRSKVWPQVPGELKGNRLTKEEQERILGYGPEGV